MLRLCKSSRCRRAPLPSGLAAASRSRSPRRSTARLPTFETVTVYVTVPPGMAMPGVCVFAMVRSLASDRWRVDHDPIGLKGPEAGLKFRGNRRDRDPIRERASNRDRVGIVRALTLIETSSRSAGAAATARQTHIDALKRREIRERPLVDSSTDRTAEVALRHQAESERRKPCVDVGACRHRVRDVGDRHHE